MHFSVNFFGHKYASPNVAVFVKPSVSPLTAVNLDRSNNTVSLDYIFNLSSQDTNYW